jgi:hypothetical protein
MLAEQGILSSQQQHKSPVSSFKPHRTGQQYAAQHAAHGAIVQSVSVLCYELIQK